jgi:hypothetical protein
MITTVATKNNPQDTYDTTDGFVEKDEYTDDDDSTEWVNSSQDSDDDDDDDDDDNQEEEESMNDKESTTDTKEEEEDIAELLRDAEQVVDRPTLRRTQRKRKPPLSFQEEYWGKKERKLLLHDVTPTELEAYFEDEEHDPEIRSSDEDEDEDEDEDDDDDDEDDDEDEDEDEKKNNMIKKK